MGSSDVHDRVCAEHNVSNDGEAFTGQTLREEAVGEGFNPFGQGVCGHRLLGPRAMGDIFRLCVAHECLVDDPAEQGCLRSEADVNGTSSGSGALGDLGKCGGHVALIKEECAHVTS